MLNITTLLIGYPHLEICAAFLPGAVHILRLRQRLAERRFDAVSDRLVDLTERRQRVRV